LLAEGVPVEQTYTFTLEVRDENGKPLGPFDNVVVPEISGGPEDGYAEEENGT
jgi:hypothetical protein